MAEQRTSAAGPITAAVAGTSQHEGQHKQHDQHATACSSRSVQSACLCAIRSLLCLQDIPNIPL
jgi:hypothetical protein